MMTTKQRAESLLKRLEQRVQDFSWLPKSESECILVDCLTQNIEGFYPSEEAEDFECLNGLEASPTNWCYKDTKELWMLVVANDYESVTMKYDDHVYIRVRKDMVYDYRAKKAI